MSETLQAELARVGVEEFTASSYRPGPVHHLVLFRFVETVSPEQQAQVGEQFRELVGSKRAGRHYIDSIEAGPQLSGEQGVNSYDYGFVVRFGSLGDRNFYVGEPVVTDPRHYDLNHAAFKASVGALLDPDGGVQVLDFQGDVTT